MRRIGRWSATSGRRGGIVGAFLFVPATAVLVAIVRELVRFGDEGAHPA